MPTELAPGYGFVGGELIHPMNQRDVSACWRSDLGNYCENAHYRSQDELSASNCASKYVGAQVEIPVTVIDVTLIKVSTNKYEGMATMQAAGHYQHQIPIHVTADDQNIMWNIDAGALLPLFY